MTLKSMDGITRAILRQIESLGYTVERAEDDAIAMSATRGNEVKTTRHVDEYLAACALADAVGIDLEDG